MIRSRPFLTFMHRLALVATLLMVCAPLVSRWLQALPGDAQPLCTSEGLREVMSVLPQASAAHVGHAMHAVAATAGDTYEGQRPVDEMADHTDHGFACDYCVLAARLLPWLAVALLLLPLLRAIAPQFRVLLLVPAAPHWPAHAPRGPPLLA
jgi:hypothetical protein